MTDDAQDVEASEAEPAHVEASEEEQPSATLILKRSGAETEIVFQVNPPCVIGRFDAAVGPIDIDLGQLDEGVYISRKHARISCEDGAWKVTDLGSSNGTFLLRDDFERVEEANLEDGAELALGNARFVFRTASAKL